MVDFIHNNNNILETHFRNFSPVKLDKLPLEQVFSIIIKELKNDLDTIGTDLENCGEMDLYIEEFCELLKAGEVGVMHLEFTLAVANSESADDIKTLKEKYNMISSSYERLRSKEDFTAVPAKYTAAIMVKVIMFEIKRLMKRCFKKTGYGDIELIRTDENLAWIKILAARFKLFDEHYPGVVTFPRDDLFCQERSSPIWQDLYQVTTIKDNYTEQQVYSSFHLLFSRVNIVRILYQNQKNYKDISLLNTAYSHLRDIIYYTLLPAKADAQARLHLVNPLVEDAFKPWRIAEHPFICFYMNLKSPLMAQNELIYVPRLFPAITGKLIEKEYQDETINKIHPMDPSDLVVPDLTEKRSEVIKELFTEKEGKIPVRILGPEGLDLRGTGQGIWSKIKEKASGYRKNSQPSQDEQAIVIHMHGGGFVSLNSDTQKVYLSRWVKNLKLVHFSIDYRLAPANMYPDALDDVWQAYLWIINYAKTILGIENQKVIIAGDSAGGTLALTLSLRLIRAGLKPPHGIALMYPALSLDENAFSPSYFLSLHDDMLPVSILKLILGAYIGKEFKSPQDPFLNPIVASDELLEKLPPVRIIAGSQDPLNDDNWRFVARLRKLNKNVKFVLYENLPHGYLSHQDLEDFDIFVKETCDVVQELIALEV